MSAYNAERYIAEAVDSVLAQSLRNFEFLIFEDASTDRTREILRSYSDPRIRLVEISNNLGLTRNLERGMLMACGDFVARMDADDVCMPHRLARQVDYFHARPDVAVLGSAVTFFGEGRASFVCYQPLEHDEIKCELLFAFTMLHSSVMMRKCALDAHGLNYDVAFPVSQDHDLWVRAIRKLRFANLREPLVKMREHVSKVGRTRNTLQRELSDVVRSRQLQELGVQASEREFRALAEHEGMTGAWTEQDCEAFDSLLTKVFEANREKRLFCHSELVRCGTRRFRGTCRQLLMAGNSAGRYYWRSAARLLGTTTLRQRLGLRVRSILMGRGSFPGLK
jgi:hypothetical protein